MSPKQRNRAQMTDRCSRHVYHFFIVKFQLQTLALIVADVGAVYEKMYLFRKFFQHDRFGEIWTSTSATFVLVPSVAGKVRTSFVPEERRKIIRCIARDQVHVLVIVWTIDFKQYLRSQNRCNLKCVCTQFLSIKYVAGFYYYAYSIVVQFQPIESACVFAFLFVGLLFLK